MWPTVHEKSVKILIGISGMLARYHDFLILLVLISFALFVRMGFLSVFPDFILHEDSGPYIDEAERLLLGRDTTDGLPGRAPGYPLFLAATITLLSPNLLATVILQHVMGVTTALLLTFCLRMLGTNRLLSYVFFMAVAFAHQLIHYDNTIGAETLTFFLMSIVFFILCGVTVKRWNPWLGAAIIGLVCAYMLLVRSATIFISLLIAAWLLLPSSSFLCKNWRQRVASAALVALPTVLTAVFMTQWNKAHYGRALLSREADPVMAFVIAYSGDMTVGNFPDVKQELKPIVEAGRATLKKEDGYSTIENYQWVFRIFDVLTIERLGSQQERDRVLSGLFWETLLTPKTLYKHLTGHTLREMDFMLFDRTRVANSTYHPFILFGFTARDSKLLKIAKVRYDYPLGVMLQAVIPGTFGAFVQQTANELILKNYVGLYRGQPGVIRFYSAVSLTFLAGSLFTRLRGWRMILWISAKTRLLSVLPTPIGQKLRELSALQGPTPHNHFAFLACGFWLGNALMACFFVYSLNRYSYYVLPFNAFTAFYALSLLRGGTALHMANARG